MQGGKSRDDLIMMGRNEIMAVSQGMKNGQALSRAIQAFTCGLLGHWANDAHLYQL